MSIDYIKLGSRIQYFRKLKHWNQEKLAERAQISPSFISYIETANRIPSIDSIVSIANALGVTPNDLLADSIHLQSGLYNCQPLLGCSSKELAFLTDAISMLRTLLQKYRIM